MKLIIYLVFLSLIVLVTFFGLGPVLIADGSGQERAMTLAVVILFYVVITWLFVRWRRKR